MYPTAPTNRHPSAVSTHVEFAFWKMITTTAEKRLFGLLSGSVWTAQKKADGSTILRQAKTLRQFWESEMREILSNKKMMDSRASHTTAQSSEHYTRTSSCGASEKAPFSAYPTSPPPDVYLQNDCRRSSRAIRLGSLSWPATSGAESSNTGDATAAFVCDKIHVHEAICIQF